MTPYILSEDQKSIYGPLIYDLYGVSNHSGSLSYGHYTAYCKGEDEQWYYFNDSMVDKINESYVVSEEAYVLFYKRRSFYPNINELNF